MMSGILQSGDNVEAFIYFDLDFVTNCKVNSGSSPVRMYTPRD
jgi:hypothetical protein